MLRRVLPELKRRGHQVVIVTELSDTTGTANIPAATGENSITPRP